MDPTTWGAGRLLRPYDQSAWVHRAIRLKVDEISRVPLKFYAGTMEHTDSAFLAWWDYPFLTAAKRPLALHDVRRQLGSWPDLGGEFFILLGDDWLAPSFSRRWQRRCRGRSSPGPTGCSTFCAWARSSAGGSPMPARRSDTLLPEQVIHSPEWNPCDDFRGSRPCAWSSTPPRPTLPGEGLYVRNLMRNNGDQGVYVIGKEGQMPTDAQREQIRRRPAGKAGPGSLRGDFSAAFLTGDIDIQDAKAQTPDADLNAGRILNRHEDLHRPGRAALHGRREGGLQHCRADSDRFTLITGSTCRFRPRWKCRAQQGRQPHAGQAHHRPGRLGRSSGHASRAPRADRHRDEASSAPGCRSRTRTNTSISG